MTFVQSPLVIGWPAVRLIECPFPRVRRGHGASLAAMTVRRGRIDPALQRGLQSKIDQLIKSFIADNPAAAGLAGSAAVRLYPKRPKGFYKEYGRVVELCILGARFRNMTNAQLAEHVGKGYPNYVVSQSFMTSPFTVNTERRVKAALSSHNRKLDLTKFNTLSRVKIALRGTAAAKEALVNRSFSATFAFTDDQAIVNDRSYTVSLTATGQRRFRMGREWIPCGALEKLLSR